MLQDSLVRNVPWPDRGIWSYHSCYVFSSWRRRIHASKRPQWQGVTSVSCLRSFVSPRAKDGPRPRSKLRPWPMRWSWFWRSYLKASIPQMAIDQWVHEWYSCQDLADCTKLGVKSILNCCYFMPFAGWHVCQIRRNQNILKKHGQLPPFVYNHGVTTNSDVCVHVYRPLCGREWLHERAKNIWHFVTKRLVQRLERDVFATPEWLFFGWKKWICLLTCFGLFTVKKLFSPLHEHTNHTLRSAHDCQRCSHCPKHPNSAMTTSNGEHDVQTCRVT